MEWSFVKVRRIASDKRRAVGTGSCSVEKIGEIQADILLGKRVFQKNSLNCDILIQG